MQTTEQATVLGLIVGKSTTREFSFQIESETKVFEYLKVFHRVFGDVLCQVMEITATLDDRIALCSIIGYRDPDGAIKGIRIPLDVGSRVLRADDDFIKSIIHLGDDHGALVGKLEGRNIPVHLDLRKILTKHVAVLAKSGAGKSYTVGVLIEEILERGVPLVIIDPHGEYATLGQPNTAKEDVEKLKWFNITAKSYTINEYGDPTVSNGQPLKLSNKMTQQELVQMIPTKLTGAQIGILYSALRNIDQVNFDTVIASLNAEESNAKWGLINILEHLRTYNIFSNDPTPYDDVVSPGTCSIINLRGIPAEIQSILVFKLTKDLFDLRKKGILPPFFLVLEEAHNFCPERSYGETTASKTIRTIASEGRKFGLGLCVISQRPARIDKSVVSQCTTQIILKVTNPNDLKAISSSVEGLTAEAEKEIANLPIGTALITGIVEVPLLVNVRPRRTLHGGHSVDIFSEIQEAGKKPKPVRQRAERISPKVELGIKIDTQQESKLEQKPDVRIEATEGKNASRENATEPRVNPTSTSGAKVANEDVKRNTETKQASPSKAPGQPVAILKPKKGIMDQLLKEKPVTAVLNIFEPAFLATCQQGEESFRLIVERTEGNIVTNINTFTTKKIPDLKNFTKEEIKLLQDTYTAKTIPSEKEKDPVVQSLVQKGYLLPHGNGLALSERYLFQKLSKVRSEDDLEFGRTSDGTVKEALLGEQQIKDILSPFVIVKNMQECYVQRILVQ